MSDRADFFGNNFRWDIIRATAAIGDGTRDAFDGGFSIVNLDNSRAVLEPSDDGRGGRLGPYIARENGNIEITRQIYVPADENFARFFDTITNTGDQTVTYGFRTRSNLGSDSGTRLVDTSDGDQEFTSVDDWIVTDDLPFRWDPAVGHVFGNGGGLAPISTSLNRDNLEYAFRLTLEPGESRSILHFGIQAYDPDLVIDIAEQLTFLGDVALAGLSEEELGRIVNFDLEVSAEPVNLDGGEAADLLEGSIFADALRGFGGDDTILGGSGNDTLDGGNGNDSVDAGRGNDLVDGGIGDDTILGNSGNDTILAGDGDDVVTAGTGADSLEGGTGNDDLAGDGGDDRLSGGDDDDLLSGGDGHDTLLGGTGNDNIAGGNNNDRIFAGDGNDTVTGDALGSDIFEFGNDLIAGMGGDDMLSGGRGNDTISGQDGNDTLSGGADRDMLFGGEGDDFIFGGYGNGAWNPDIAWGGDGADRFFSAGVRNSTLHLMDYDAAEGDVLVVDGTFFDISDFELRGITTVQPGVPGASFRPTDLVRLLPNGEAMSLFSFSPDFDGTSITLRLASPDGAETTTFDFA